MSNYFYNFLASDTFDDLKEIATKIIPDDPWAFVVQIVATLFLVLILAKFLVKPVKNYISARQEYIQNNLDEANNKNTIANEKLMEADQKLKDAKIVSKEMIENAKVTALNEKDKIIEDTKKEVSLMKEKAHQDIVNERKQMEEELTSNVIDVALLAAGKVIGREVNEQDNLEIINSFIEKKDKE